MEIPLGDTYYFKFTTRSFSTGAPTTLSGTPAISIYEENNLTQITAGVTLTVDYDSVTGLNDVAIVATSGNGYEVGKYYDAVITTGTVGGVSVVGETIGHFRVMPAEDAGAGIKDVNVTHVSDSAEDISTATALATAQADLDTITGADGVTMASSQGDITFGAITVSVTDATNNITLAGSGTGDGLVFTRSGSGGLFGTNWAAAIQQEATDALNTYDPPTNTEMTAAFTEIKGATWATTDTLEAIRDRGDAAWLTATGFSTHSAADVRAEMDANSTQLAKIDGLAIKKNTAFSNFEFLMVLTSDHVTPATGLTVTGERSIDGGAFAAISGTIAEVSNGIYQFDALAADTNGDVITWRFSSATADDAFYTFKTVA